MRVLQVALNFGTSALLSHARVFNHMSVLPLLKLEDIGCILAQMHIGSRKRRHSPACSVILGLLVQQMHTADVGLAEKGARLKAMEILQYKGGQK